MVSKKRKHKHQLEPDDCFLMVVDMQEKLLSAIHHGDSILRQAKIITEGFRLLNLPIVLTEQVPEKLGKTASELSSLVKLEASVFEKNTFDAMATPDIHAFVHSLQRKQVVLCGLESHICINQTAHQLQAENFEVHIVTDAIGSRHKHNHKAALSKFTQSGLIPTTVEMALFELLDSSEHPAFKAIQALVKETN